MQNTLFNAHFILPKVKIMRKLGQYQAVEFNTTQIATLQFGSYLLHLPTFHLLGFCWDGHSRPKNRWDGAQQWNSGIIEY